MESLTTSTLVPATVPKCTEVAPVKLVPKRVTSVPPVMGPELGETSVTVGTPPVVELENVRDEMAAPTGGEIARAVKDPTAITKAQKRIEILRPRGLPA